jgi:putative transport protein
MNWHAEFLRRYPEIAVFLVVGLGALIGKIKLGGISIGGVTGSLFAGLVIGQLNVPVAPAAKGILYLLFLVANGYSIGPQFFRSLNREGLRYFALAGVQCSVGLAAAIAMARLLHLDIGLGAGLLSGALTQSPAIGTASEAISALHLPQAQKDLLIAHVAIGDALTYLFGTAGVIWFLSLLAPKLLRIDLQGEARKLEADLHMDQSADFLSTYTPFALRAYRLANRALAGTPVRDFESSFPGKRIYVEHLRRNGAILELTEETRLIEGDILALGGRRAAVMEIGRLAGEEVDDRELLDMPGIVQTVTISSEAISGVPLATLGQSREARGIFLRRIKRAGIEIPVTPGTTLDRGDVVELVGSAAAIKRYAPSIGTPHRTDPASDLAAIGIAVFVGGLIGAPFVLIHGFRVSLGTAVGALVAGILLGRLHSIHPAVGRIPEAAVSLMIPLGLSAFVGMNGMMAGTHFVEAFKTQGVPMLLGGVVVTLLPLICGVLFGRYVLKLNPILLLGACAGAQTVTAAMAEVQEKSGSRTPALGYTVPYAIGNILLTLWGSVIVIVLSQS